MVQVRYTRRVSADRVGGRKEASTTGCMPYRTVHCSFQLCVQYNNHSLACVRRLIYHME